MAVKFRATATVTWEFTTELPLDKASEMAQGVIDSVSYPGLEFKTHLRLDKLKEKIQRVKVGEFQSEDVFPFLASTESKKQYHVDGKAYSVKMNSHRYFLFRESRKCVSCGLEATKIFLEHHPSDKTPHFNFYGEDDGKLILFTKDHILPKSLGGEDRHSNYQTMCIVCNNLKGHANLTVDSIRQLRECYEENRVKLTKKKLHLLVESEKTRLSRPWSCDPEKTEKNSQLTFAKKIRPSADAVVSICDMSIWHGVDQFYGRSIYDKQNGEEKYVACIKKGTFLEPIVSVGNSVVCNFIGEEPLSVPKPFVRPWKQVVCDAQSEAKSLV